MSSEEDMEGRSVYSSTSGKHSSVGSTRKDNDSHGQASLGSKFSLKRIRVEDSDAQGIGDVSTEPKAKKTQSEAAKERRRERNRLLAKSTRLKKKTEVQILKESITSLKDEIESAREGIRAMSLFHDIRNILKLSEDDSFLLVRLVAERYSEEQRAYHTLGHIESLMKLFRMYSILIIDHSTVLLSILFHDIIYDPTSNDNEENSVRCFKETCDKLQSLACNHDKVMTFIMATKSHEIPTDQIDHDLELFLDMDMSILGSDPREYGEYAMNIRREYKHISASTYCLERAKVLRKFLLKPVFNTDSFRKFYGGQAVSNILWECSILESGRLIFTSDFTQQIIHSVPLIPFTMTGIEYLAIKCKLSRLLNILTLEFSVSGNIDCIKLPSLSGQPVRENNLWQHTCFECFLSQPHHSHYWELNLSPTGDWNAFSFSDYREGSRVEERIVNISVLEVTRSSDKYLLSAAVDLSTILNQDILTNDLVASTTAVIEDHAGVKTFWANIHKGDAPDFHVKESRSLLL